MLVAQLPPESATSTALRLRAGEPGQDIVSVERDPETEQWSRTEQLLAAVRDEIHFLRYGFIAVNSKSMPKWKPEPLPRPGVSSTERARTGLSTEQNDRLWAHLQAAQPPEAIEGT